MKTKKRNIGKLGWAVFSPCNDVVPGSKGSWKIRYTIESRAIGVGGVIKIGLQILY